jgi:hypothetical protein
MLTREAIILIEQVKNLGYKPNSWETNFILSIINMAKRNSNLALTYNQSKAVNTIYSKAAGGGRFQKREYIGGRR